MSNDTGPKERILHTATRLFYKQGYNTTGINQILEEANVAKASLYQHYGSKEDVGVEYLKAARVEWFEGLDKWVGQKTNVLQMINACFDFLEFALRSNEFKGCKFINMMAEVGDASPAMYQQIIEHKTKLRMYFRDIVKEMSAADALGDAIYVLFEGAIVECKIHKDVWPIRTAKKTIKQLIGQ
jgi:AcrR family transcriptional regulator